MDKRYRILCCVFLLNGLAASFCSAQTQAASPASSTVQPAHEVPVMDGGAGPCSLEFTVMTSDSKPVYAATIKVRVAYGFAGFHKLDLQASTNIDGKARFVGLPSRVRRPPLEFQVSKDQLAGTATYDPASECQAKHDVMLDIPKAQSSN